MKEIRKLTIKDKEELDLLIEVILKNLLKPEYFTKIEKHSYDHFLDDNYSRFYGIFIDGKMAAVATLFLDEYEYAELCDAINISKDNIAEIGRAMVHPDFRGNHYEREIVGYLIDVAKDMKLKRLIATVHPDNIPSQKCFNDLNFKKVKTIVKHSGYLRDVYLKEL